MLGLQLLSIIISFFVFILLFSFACSYLASLLLRLTTNIERNYNIDKHKVRKLSPVQERKQQSQRLNQLYYIHHICLLIFTASDNRQDIYRFHNPDQIETGTKVYSCQQGHYHCSYSDYFQHTLKVIEAINKQPTKNCIKILAR